MRTPVALVAACGVLLMLPAAAAAQAGASPPPAAFQKVTLNERPGEPMSLAVLPNRRVLHTTRTGQIRLHDPQTGLNTLAAEIPVYQHDEEGLQGIAIDPGFEANRWVYLYYSPPLDTPEGNAPFDGTEADFARFEGVVRLSRFKFRQGTLDLGSEQQIIDIPTDRGICCDVGGQIDFDGQGNLFLSTGDDTMPFFSDGYAPIDDRPGRNPAFDARRSAGDTSDLRGKLLRIRVGPDGGFTVPAGNLFPQGLEGTRPEIYAMGLRNPFRFAVNGSNGDVYLADHAPDSPEPDPLRGPAGHGRWMLIDGPGNYGWPYCLTPDLPYVDFDFATGTSGKEFNCQRPTNDSRHNGGLRRLPEVVQPDVWYTYPDSSQESGLFPELFEQLGGDGIGPMGGPAYRFDPQSGSVVRWPQYFDGQPLFYEWTRDYIKELRLNRPNGNRLADIRHVPAFVDNPMDMEFGRDGALYVLEYGDGFFSENPDAQLARVDYVRGNRTPVPVVSIAGHDPEAGPLTGHAPLAVQFSSAGTADADGDRLAYRWDFDADGVVDSRERNPRFTYTENGVFDATLRVTDATGRSAAASIVVIVE
jgi:glucose/arabinose dehydrogenase